MTDNRDLTETITAALTSPNPTDAVRLLIANALHEAAETQRANTTANRDRVAAAYGPLYGNGWTAGRLREADAIDEQANLIAALTTVIPLPVQRNLRSVA